MLASLITICRRVGACLVGGVARRRSLFSAALVAVLMGVLQGCDNSYAFMLGGPRLSSSDPQYMRKAVSSIQRSLPTKLNRITEVSDVAAVGRRMEYTVRMVHSPTRSVDHNQLRETQELVAEYNCRDRRARDAMDAGITMQYVVRGMDDGVAGRFAVSDSACRRLGY